MSRTRVDFVLLKKQRDDTLQENDIITREGSEKRLQILMIISSLIFATFCAAFALTLEALDHSPEIFIPKPDTVSKGNFVIIF